MTQPIELIRFISDVPVLNNGVIPINRVENETNFESMYDPTFSLSALALSTIELIKSGKIEVVDERVPDYTLVGKALRSDLASGSPSVYLLCKAVALESFALLYHVERQSRDLMYVSRQDITRVRTNVKYLADYMGTNTKYHHIIEVLRHMNISLGYLQNQIELMVKNSRGVS